MACHARRVKNSNGLFRDRTGVSIVPLLSWHQMQSEAQVGPALHQVKEVGLIPEDQVRLGGVGGGISWIVLSLEHLLDHPAHRLGFEGLFEPRVVDLGEKGPGFRAQHIPGQEYNPRQQMWLAAL